MDDDGANTYYTELFGRLGVLGVLEVRDAGDGRGKGIFAARDIPEGSTIFEERPLAVMQHLENEGQAVVCAECLAYVGSIELQAGHKLTHIIQDLRSLAHGPAAEGGQHQERGAAGGAHGQPGAKEGEEDEEAEDEDGLDLQAALEAGERLEQVYSTVGEDRVHDLTEGRAQLPLADKFSLPAPVACRRSCGAVYCGAACEEAAWRSHHCLLCQAAQDPVAACAASAPASAGPSAGELDAGGAGPSTSATAPGGCSSSAGGSSSAAADEVIDGTIVCRTALRAFYDHARQTNDIFILAAKVVAQTLLRAARLLLQADNGSSSNAVAAGASDGPESSGRPAPAPPLLDGAAAHATSDAVAAAGPACGQGTVAAATSDVFAAAWLPYALGWKRVWWECVAVPDDVDDEDEFREQLRSLAAESLELLQAAIKEQRFKEHLLTLDVYGSIVGMFELNNLGVSVPTPVEDYFLLVDEMEDGPEKEAVAKVTGPLLDALDSDYATPCEATAFMALQSCANHSCEPNAVASCDKGSALVSIVARRDVQAGEEVTMSYIDEGMPYKQRQAALRDYGFVCRCPKCVADAAARAKSRAAKGVMKAKGRR